jgi:hypothetical protein
VGNVEVGVRLATGNEENPVSTNDTLGDYQTGDDILVDRGYLKWSYKPADTVFGKIPQISLTGGRIPNPWFYSNLVWDHDLNFEGLALNFQTDTLKSNPLRGFLNAGVFSIQEVEFSDKDKWLWATQLGMEYTQARGLSTKIGVAYYDYVNIVGQRNDPASPGEKDFTAPLFQQKGNTLMDIDPSADIKTALASDFDLLNVTAQFDYGYWSPIHIILLADYVINLGFDQDKVSERAGADVPEDNQGYHVGLQVGYPEPKHFGEWNYFFFYKYIEADSVLDAYTDTDFHGGGTNTKGWILGAKLGVYKNVWLRARWLTADEIRGPQLAIDTLQLDLNAVF